MKINNFSPTQRRDQVFASQTSIYNIKSSKLLDRQPMAA